MSTPRSRRRVLALLLTAVTACALVVPAASWAEQGNGEEKARAHVVEQAHKPTGRKIPKGNGKPAKVKAFADGCDRAYGTQNQCIPSRAPGNVPVTCAYLRAAGFLDEPLVVHDDHLGLVRGGVVCPPP